MRVPYEWLKQYVEVKASAEEVATRLTMGGLEVEGIETSDIGPVIDVYVTPNRGDCLSMVGVAREVAALFGLELKRPVSPPSMDGGAVASHTNVTIEDMDLCPRYAARIVRDVKVGPSPEWMQKRLEAAGQRPINNVVDVTNYVLLELGQPLHAFDLDLLKENRIVVRRAREGESISTLDGEERALTIEMLIIADAERPIAVAGVMGGSESEVSEQTANLLFESAHFNPLSVRRTSRSLGLRTEASYRFERVVDPDGVRRAVDRACQLLEEMGQPAAVEGVVDVYPKPIETRRVELRIQRAADLLGMDVPSHAAADALRALGFDVLTEAHGVTDTLVVTVPTYRPDVAIEEDLIEEVGRIYGYENIPETLPIGSTTAGGDSAEGRFIRNVRELLAGSGLQEVITHSLTAPSFFDTPEDATKRVPIRNALSAEISGLRRSLIPTLLDVAEHNAGRGRQALAIFEVGRVWHLHDGEPMEAVSVAGLLVGPLTPSGWRREDASIPADFALVRSVVERLLNGLEIPHVRLLPPEDFAAALAASTAPGERAVATSDPRFHPGRVAFVTQGFERPLGVVGELHPRIAQRYALRDRIMLFELSLEALETASSSEMKKFAPVSRYPAVSRDVAPRVATSVPYVQVETAVHEANAPNLEEFRLTDLFEGPPLPENVMSFTLSLTFRSQTGTLTDAEVNGYVGSIRESLERVCGATFPS